MTLRYRVVAFHYCIVAFRYHIMTHQHHIVALHYRIMTLQHRMMIFHYSVKTFRYRITAFQYRIMTFWYRITTHSSQITAFRSLICELFARLLRAYHCHCAIRESVLPVAFHLIGHSVHPHLFQHCQQPIRARGREVFPQSDAIYEIKVGI